MPSLHEVVRAHTDLDHADREWLHLLVADWQILADLSFADLVLWVPDADHDGFWAAAQIRPTTGPTAIVDDVVGAHDAAGQGLLHLAWTEHRIVREGEPEWRGEVPVRVEAVPVLRDGRPVAVVTRHTNLQGVRTPSRLELTYLDAAAELSVMLGAGLLPQQGQRGDHTDSPRVGDGFIRLDAGGRVRYASPNAQSVYRRLGFAGDLEGRLLADVTRDLVPARQRPDEETLSAVLGGRVPRDAELGNDEATVVMRSIPLLPQGERTGALVLLRDVTDLRRRDRELVTKDATIREIHHRVKNNLQTVAALLRLQARRLGDGPADATGRQALDEAVRRVAAIAVVHETLSQSFDESVPFDEVADQLARLLADVGGRGEHVALRRTGSFGTIGSALATPLAMVLTELLQNAVEHAFPDGAGGVVQVRAGRGTGRLVMEVIDDGRGLPAGFDPAASGRLGLSIVRTLVAEAGGRLTMGAAGPDGGTTVRVELETS
ncbi:MAG: sensor histidine kinase [Marmoricola sp.]